MGPSGSAGLSRFPQLRARPTRDCPSTRTLTNLTFSSCPVLKISFLFWYRMAESGAEKRLLRVRWEAKYTASSGTDPRIEGLFARIERWTNTVDPADTFWGSISKDNITTFYGKTAESRIADPADAARIFSWLTCQSYDDKGNAIVYRYAEENSDGIDLSQAHEKNRTPSIRTTNRYLKHIRYGNRQPNRDPDWNATDPVLLPASTWMLEVVFDYGDNDLESPLPEEPDKRWPVPKRSIFHRTGQASKFGPIAYASES